MIARDLKRQFHLQTDDPTVHQALGYLACAPDVAGPGPRDVHVAIEPFERRWRIIEDGMPLKEVLTPIAALDFLHVHLFGCSIADQPAAAVLHAACLRRDDKRILLAGTKGAGKSTLTLRLLEVGFEFEGDEHVFVENGVVTARPRACRVKETSLQHLPNLRAVIAGSPYYETFDGERIFNVDPRTLGSATWRIERGRVNALIALHRNHGGFSSIRPMSPSMLVQFLIPETGWREQDRNRSVASIALLAARVRGFDLSLGDIAGAIRCIERALLSST